MARTGGSLIAWAVAALALAPPTAAASFNRLALGDSITQGVCDTGVASCPSFTCPSGTNLNGYPSRLATDLGCNLQGLDFDLGHNGPPTLCTGSCCVVAAGRYSFQTPQMLSWFNAILGDYDVILIMGGTNDIFVGTSNATIETNIKLIDDAAVSRGIDPLLSSVIHYLDDVAAPFAADVADLRNRIQTVATNRNRWYADPWTPLCGNAACFDYLYYQGGGDPVGHPNGCGYDVLKDAFKGAILSAPLPGAPALGGPSGDVTDTTPTLSWTAATDATWHQIEVDNGGTWADLSQLADSCTGSACSRTTTALAAGDHTWRVRGRNPRGYGPWSSLSFEIFTAAPQTPTAMAPSGSFFTVPPSAFEWSDESAPANGATGYSLRIVKDAAEVFNGPVTPSCNGSTCMVAPPVALTVGSYTWEVKSSNVAGDSALSPALAFAVFPPPPPTQVYPLGDETFDDTPLFTWAEIGGATEYRVEVRNATLTTVWDSGLLAAGGLCSGNCSIASAVSLAKEAHSWRVRAKSGLGESTPSGWESFTVLDCMAFPDVELPPPATVSSAETHKACNAIDVGDVGPVTVQGPSGALTLHAGDLLTIFELTVENGAELVLITDP